MHHRIFEGTWAEVSRQAAKLEAEAHVRLEVIEPVEGAMIKAGMFPGLQDLTDEDFRAAEWRPAG